MEKQNTTDFFYAGAETDDPELPIDLSENKFNQRLRQKGIELGHDAVATVLRNMSNKMDPENGRSIYADIYLNQELRGKADDGKTKAYTFFYEALDLLEAIAAARFKGGRSDVDKIAKDAVTLLGETLAKNDPSKVPQDHASIILLSDAAVQHTMNMRFDEELRQRLTEIWDLIHKLKIEHGPALMTFTLARLDMVLTYLRNPFYHAKRRKKSETDLQLLNRLYFDLTTARNKMRNLHKVDDTAWAVHKLRFSLANTPENKDLLDDLKGLLGARASGLDDSQLEELADLYNKYLITADSCSSAFAKRKNKAVAFFNNYRFLEQYVRGRTNIATFEQQVRDELGRIARNYLNYYDQSPPQAASCFDMVFSHADGTYAYSLLNDFSQELSTYFGRILQTLHDAHIIKAFFFGQYTPQLSVNCEVDDIIMECTSEQHPMEFLYLLNTICNHRSALHHVFRDLPLLRDYGEGSILNFVAAYNQICVPVFMTKPLDSVNITMLAQSIYRGKQLPLGMLYKQMAIQETLLRYEAEMAIAELKERYVNTILTQADPAFGAQK